MLENENAYIFFGFEWLKNLKFKFLGLLCRFYFNLKNDSLVIKYFSFEYGNNKLEKQIFHIIISHKIIM